MQCLNLGCGREPSHTNWYQIEVINFKQKKENGRSIRWHVQVHRLQLLSGDAEDEGHAGGQGSLAAAAVRRWKTRQHRCTDLGGDALEDDNIHLMLHRHEHVQQLQ